MECVGVVHLDLVVALGAIPEDAAGRVADLGCGVFVLLRLGVDDGGDCLAFAAAADLNQFGPVGGEARRRWASCAAIAGVKLMTANICAYAYKSTTKCECA